MTNCYGIIERTYLEDGKVMNKNFDITNTISVEELAKRWGVTKKTIDNRRYRGQGPSHFKIGGAIKYDLDDVRRMESESYVDVNK
ncbi:helix-turn-helix domain-containing protein [Gammaproteobacteria bacterium]|nr:helix-turn-helix domain-containing protein [Gammaproteobacteria bacterium]